MTRELLNEYNSYMDKELQWLREQEEISELLGLDRLFYEFEYEWADTGDFVVLTEWKVNQEDIVVPSFIATIGSYAFMKCTKLKKIDLFNATGIQERAFFNLDRLEEVKVGRYGLDFIDNGAFYGCRSLNHIDLNTCDDIHKNAFVGSAYEKYII